VLFTERKQVVEARNRTRATYRLYNKAAPRSGPRGKQQTLARYELGSYRASVYERLGSTADCKGHHVERRDAMSVVRRIERFDLDLKLPT
jgi:hypothetical protein